MGQAWAVASSNRKVSHMDSGIDRLLTTEAIQGRFPRGGASGDFVIFLKLFFYLYISLIFLAAMNDSNLKLTKIPNIESRNS